MVDALLDCRVLAAVFVPGPAVNDHKVCSTPALAVGRLKLEVKTLHQQRTVTIRNKNVLLKNDSNQNDNQLSQLTQ